MEHKALGKNELKQKRHLQSKWTLPMNSFVKINTNGAFRESSRSRGWGFILNNDQGVPMAARCGHIQGIGSALQFEAIATLQAIKITSQMGCNRVQLEMDSYVLKKAITSKEYDLAPIGSRLKRNKGFTL
jgi:ribonuclease HI